MDVPRKGRSTDVVLNTLCAGDQYVVETKQEKCDYTGEGIIYIAAFTPMPLGRAGNHRQRVESCEENEERNLILFDPKLKSEGFGLGFGLGRVYSCSIPRLVGTAVASSVKCTQSPMPRLSN